MASTKCVGCDFVAQFSPHDGGYCQVHGDIPGTPKRDIGQATIIERLGGNTLSLLEDCDDPDTGHIERA